MESPAGSGMPARHPNGHVRLTAGELVENSGERFGLKILILSVCGVCGHQCAEEMGAPGEGETLTLTEGEIGKRAWGDGNISELDRGG